MMNTHTVPCAEFEYDDLGVSLIVPRRTALDGGQSPQARVVILPDWQGGHTHYATRMAAMFGEALQAETLIFNQYSTGVQPATYAGDGDMRIVRLMADLDRFRCTLLAFLARAASHWKTQSTPLILIGFCFGGTAAFEAARAGAEIDMAFSVHGTPVVDPARMRRPGKGPTMHYIGGGDDGLVPSWTVSAFREEIAQPGAQGSIHFVPGQGHSFTKKEIGYVGPLSRYSAPALFQTLQLTRQIVTADPSGQNSKIEGDAQ